ncbi:MAG TPA: hypothetical protein VK595_10800, partial [Vicinamibacterales bacterium]|nr:hypothetical protein [Vicinamibacterales bacterium]
MVFRRPLRLIVGKHYVLEGDCWVWLGKKNQGGYGFSGAGLWQLHPLAHRASFILAGNDLQPGIHLHHRCENKACVNPEHLEPSLGRLHLAHHRQEESPLT